MKRMLTLALMCAITLASTAQAWIPADGDATTSKRSVVNFESHHGEAFTVYIDGDIANRMPQGHVTVNNVSRQYHEVVVVLRRPAEKAAVINLLPSEDNVIVNVDYDLKGEYLHLFTAPINRYIAPAPHDGQHVHPTPHPTNPMVPVPIFDGNNVTVVVDGMSSRMATDLDVDDIVGQMKAAKFDSDRLALARTLLAPMLFSSEQIARIAQSLDFSNSQVEFLKQAYSHCSDPRNYSRALEVLSFTSDRRKVTDYIATQH